MSRKIICEIKDIFGELSEVNSRNTQKVVALASWNNREDTINIREANVVDNILLKGISLSPEETEKLVYSLLASKHVDYDADRAIKLIKEREDSVVDIESMINDLDEEEYGSDYKRNENGGITLSKKERD